MEKDELLRAANNEIRELREKISTKETRTGKNELTQELQAQYKKENLPSKWPKIYKELWSTFLNQENELKAYMQESELRNAHNLIADHRKIISAQKATTADTDILTVMKDLLLSEVDVLQTPGYIDTIDLNEFDRKFLSADKDITGIYQFHNQSARLFKGRIPSLLAITGKILTDNLQK